MSPLPTSANSNTTLVKVKWQAGSIRNGQSTIQIQLLLKLNLGNSIKGICSKLIQIQLLLKLNTIS